MTRYSLALALAIALGLHVSAQQPPRKVVHVTAERFSFSPSEIVVDEGTVLEIQLRSDDTNHGFRILGTDVNVTIPKRGKGMATVMFTPPKPGKYIFECSKVCGAGHAFMRGTLIAE